MSVFHTHDFFTLHGLQQYSHGNVRLFLKDGRTIGTYGGFSSSCLESMEYIAKELPSCQIKLAPAGHDQELFALSTNVLGRNGFVPTSYELNYERRIVNDFESQLSKGNRKVLRHSLDVEQPTSLENAYHLILADRQSKSRTLSMSLQDVHRMNLISRWLIFGVGTDTLNAAALCLMVRTDILYVYAWGGRKEGSPTVKLAQVIYNWCLLNNIRLMDIGTSTVNGTPDYGLIQFKKSLGFSESLKMTMKRDYVPSWSNF